MPQICTIIPQTTKIQYINVHNPIHKVFILSMAEINYYKISTDLLYDIITVNTQYLIFLMS